MAIMAQKTVNKGVKTMQVHPSRVKKNISLAILPIKSISKVGEN
jgi:hypothetical protein